MVDRTQVFIASPYSDPFKYMDYKFSFKYKVREAELSKEIVQDKNQGKEC